MISKKRLAANRRNAQRSTGPRTPEGRRAVSLNALKHGLRSRLTVIPGEDPAEFQALFDQFCEDARPCSARDLVAIRKAAAAEWRLRRVFAIETRMFARSLETAPPPPAAPGPITMDSVEALVHRLSQPPAAPPPPPADPHDHLAGCMLGGRATPFSVLARYEANLHRQYQQAWRDIDARPMPSLQATDPDEPALHFSNPDEPALQATDPKEPARDPSAPEKPASQQPPEPPSPGPNAIDRPTPDAGHWKSAFDRYAEALNLNRDSSPTPTESELSTAPSDFCQANPNPRPNPMTPSVDLAPPSPQNPPNPETKELKPGENALEPAA